MFLPKLFFSDLYHVDHSTAKRVWSTSCRKHWLSLSSIFGSLLAIYFLIWVYLPETASRLWGAPTILNNAMVALFMCVFTFMLLRSKLEAEIKLQLSNLVKEDDNPKEEL